MERKSGALRTTYRDGAHDEEDEEEDVGFEEVFEEVEVADLRQQRELRLHTGRRILWRVQKAFWNISLLLAFHRYSGLIEGTGTF